MHWLPYSGVSHKTAGATCTTVVRRILVTSHTRVAEVGQPSGDHDGATDGIPIHLFQKPGWVGPRCSLRLCMVSEASESEADPTISMHERAKA